MKEKIKRWKEKCDKIGCFRPPEHILHHEIANMPQYLRTWFNLGKREQMKLKEHVKIWEKQEYKSFEYRWLYERHKNPNIAITSGIARNIASLIFMEKE